MWRLRKAAVGLSGFSALNVEDKEKTKKKSPVKSFPHGTIKNIPRRSRGLRRPGQKSQREWVVVATVYLRGLPVSMLVSTKAFRVPVVSAAGVCTLLRWQREPERAPGPPAPEG